MKWFTVCSSVNCVYSDYTTGSKNWTKIHQKQFDKMDSIDVYLSKKRKRQEDFTNSAKKTKLLLEETKEAITRLKSHKTPMQLKVVC